jgi:hypothetical protein
VTTWIENDDLFREQLIAGRRVEFVLAIDLLDLGFGVKVGQLEYRDSFGADFADQADVMVGGGHVLEVKSRSLHFTCPGDYPFDPVYLGNGRRWMARRKRPCHFVIVSSAGSRLAISTATSDSWKVDTTHDSVRDIYNTVLTAPRSLLVPFESLVEHLRKHCSDDVCPCCHRPG